ncbi:MAG: hypothetical protein AAF126_13020 [Chloroflexota bacterium]
MVAVGVGVSVGTSVLVGVGDGLSHDNVDTVIGSDFSELIPTVSL